MAQVSDLISDTWCKPRREISSSAEQAWRLEENLAEQLTLPNHIERLVSVIKVVLLYSCPAWFYVVKLGVFVQNLCFARRGMTCVFERSLGFKLFLIILLDVGLN